MAKKKKNQPEAEGGKAFVIIVLAFFVMLSIGLGYTTYEFYSKVEAANAAKVEAEKNFADAKKLTDLEKERVAFYKGFIGIASADDLTTLKSLKNDAEIRKDHEALMKFAQDSVQTVAQAKAASFVGLPGGEFRVTPADTITWNWPAGGQLSDRPSPEPLIPRFVDLLAKADIANRRVIQQLNINKDLEATLKDAKADYEKEKAKLAEVAARLPQEAKMADAKREADFKQRLNEMETFLKGFRLNKNELEGAKNEKLALEEKIREFLEQIKDLNSRIAAKDAEKEDLFPFDTPKGSIDVRRQNIVEINLGSADNVKPGLTFNVMPIEVKERGLQSRTRTITIGDQTITKIVPKGSIEVVEVLGPHLSTARITSEEQAIRDPIMKTDLLYNAAWRKGQADHVVLAGVFDVDGDGTDDIKQVVREIGRMGIIIDGYYDLIERKWVGGGPTPKTNYIIEGEYPKISAEDALLQLKTDLSNAIGNARREAVDKGAKAVRHRDFFPRIGYKVNYDVSDEKINQAAARYLRPREENPGN